MPSRQPPALSPEFLPADGPPPSGLLHTAYYAALAALERREDTPQWHATVAGLVTLRLVDRWIASARRDSPSGGSVTTSIIGDDLAPAVLVELVEAAGRAVAAMDSGDSQKSLLEALVAAATTGASDALAQVLLAYAHALHSDARWSLAADVYETIGRLAATPRSYASTALRVLEPVASERLGHSRRMMGDLDGASAAYAAARAAACASGDRVRELRIEISEANLLMHVGNLPAAATALEDIIAEASHLAEIPTSRSAASPPPDSWPLADVQISPRDVLALARQDRGVVATMQRDYPFAIEHFFSAWRGFRDPTRRERVWCDMARALADMGLRHAAHDAYLVLHMTAREREIQLAAATNLLELAVIDGQQDAFVSYRAGLDEAAASGTLPAWLAPWVAFYIGMGEACFGHPDRARVTWNLALTLATESRVNEVIIRIDAALAALDAGRALDLPTVPSVPVAAPIERITRVVRRVRRRLRIAEPWPTQPATSAASASPMGTRIGDRESDPSLAPADADHRLAEPAGVDSHGRISSHFPR